MRIEWAGGHNAEDMFRGAVYTGIRQDLAGLFSLKKPFEDLRRNVKTRLTKAIHRIPKVQ